MYYRNGCLALLFLVLIPGSWLHGKPMLQQDPGHIGVSLRMIGHQILLNAGDSTSRVLPVTREGERYRIQFATEFEFHPDELVQTVDRVVRSTQMAQGYLVEVEQCATGKIVHSYKIGNIDEPDIVPCKGRVQPRSCYNILFTIIDQKTALALEEHPLESEKLSNDKKGAIDYVIVLPILLLMSVLVYIMARKRQPTGKNPDMITLGDYLFNKRHNELKIGDERIELTGKEAELLNMLYSAVNTTIEREVILKGVWGDDGDYVGRTLDVFISKLRKKLEADPRVKIINIRGVGYKLVMGEGPTRK